MRHARNRPARHFRVCLSCAGRRRALARGRAAGLAAALAMLTLWAVSGSAEQNPAADAASLEIYFGHRGSVLETVRAYQPLLDFLGRRLNLRVGFRWYDEYRQVLDDLSEDPSLLALVDGTTYLYLKERRQVRQVGVARVHERLTRRGYLVARSGSGIVLDLADFRGKTVGVVGLDDAVSSLWLSTLLGDRGGRYEEFFGEVVVTGSPTESLLQVALGMADLAAVDEWTYDVFIRIHRHFRPHLRVLLRSPPLSNPVLVAGPRIDPDLFARLRQELEGMGTGLEGSAVSLASGIDGFVHQPDEFFDADARLLPFLAVQRDWGNGPDRP